MGKVIVTEFVSLDGVMEDPDGTGGTPQGGWAFRHGREAVVGDKFKLGGVLDTGVMLLGRVTWQQFSKMWPTRDDEYSQKMNSMPKLVASRSLEDVTAWANSSLLKGDVPAEVSTLRETRDVFVAGSAEIVEELQAHDLVDEYRLLVFPSVVGEGRRVFGPTGKPVDLELVSVETVGKAVRLVYTREPAK